MNWDENTFVKWWKLIKFGFSKQKVDNNLSYLTKKQIKKYRRDFLGTMIYAMIISTCFIFGLLELSISIFTIEGYLFVKLMLIMSCAVVFENVLEMHRDDLELLSERIEKRSRRNLFSKR